MGHSTLARNFIKCRPCFTSAVISYGSVSVCRSQAGIVLKWLNESSLFHIVLEGNSGISKNKGKCFLLERCPKLCNCTSTVASVVNLGRRLVW